MSQSKTPTIFDILNKIVDEEFDGELDENGFDGWDEREIASLVIAMPQVFTVKALHKALDETDNPHFIWFIVGCIGVIGHETSLVPLLTLEDEITDPDLLHHLDWAISQADYDYWKTRTETRHLARCISGVARLICARKRGIIRNGESRDKLRAVLRGEIRVKPVFVPMEQPEMVQGSLF